MVGRWLVLLDSAYLSIKTYSYWSLYLYQGDSYFSLFCKIEISENRKLSLDLRYFISCV